jgi:putative flippase GtrA
MSIIYGTANNFIFNRKYTFKTTDKPFKRALSFFSIAAIGWIAGYFLIIGFVYLFNNELNRLFVIENQAVVQNISKLFSTVIVAGLQFFANKYITFRKR